MKIESTAAAIAFLAWAGIAPAQTPVMNNFLFNANLIGLSGSIFDVTLADMSGLDLLLFGPFRRRESP